MRQKSDSVFLLTLVDLLVQIIFLAIFLGAIYFANDEKNNIEKKYISDPKAKIIVEVGVLKVAEIVNAMVKLVPVDRLMELVVLLPEFKSIEALKAALRLASTAKFDPELLDKQNKELEKKIAYGVGLPACQFGVDKSKTLLVIQEQSNSYKIAKLTSKAKELFLELKINFVEGQEINFIQFNDVGRLISNTEKNCRYQVIYQPSSSDSLTAYRNISRYFYPQIQSTARVQK
jgi:hypothetical protein